MTKEFFTDKGCDEAEIARLQKYMEDSAFLGVYFLPKGFLGQLVPFAVRILESVEAEKKAPFTTGRNEARYTVLRALNKLSLKSVESVELVHVLNKTLQSDNLPNVILALKALGSVSRSKMMSMELVDLHMSIVLGVVHELFGNVEGMDEGLVEMSLFGLVEVMNHVCGVFHRFSYHMIKVDQFLMRVYGYVRRALENRRFLEQVLHKKGVSIEFCSLACRVLKLTHEHIPVVPRMSPYYMFVSEVGLIAAFYCPPDVSELRREICFFFTKMCVNNREGFLPVIDKIYTLPFLFSPDTPAMNVKGIGVLSEILGHFKESVTKAAYLDFGFRVSEVMESLHHSASLLWRKTGGGCGTGSGGAVACVEEDEVFDLGLCIESFRILISSVENMCRCFGSRTNDVVELHDFHLRCFYDICHGFKSIREMAGLVREDSEKGFSELVQVFVSGLKEVVGRIGAVERSGVSVTILSTEEIHMLYSMFSESFEVLCIECVCQETVIGEFFSVLGGVRESVANDIIKSCSSRMVECARRLEGFFGMWRVGMGSTVLGNAIIAHTFPQVIRGLETEDMGFVRKMLGYVVPFFTNDIKKIRKINIFLMHKLISTLMTTRPVRMEYFSVLLEIFNMFGSMPEKSSFFQKYIFDNFVKIVEHLMRLYEKDGNRIFIEMIFSLPISINLVETDIQFLVRPIERALQLGGNVRSKALSVLVYVVDFSQRDKCVGEMEELWERILESVMCGLGEPEVSLQCAKVVGKLKGYHKEFVGRHEFREDRSGECAIRFVLDGKHRVAGHSVFLEAVQNIRGRFEGSGYGFDSERSLVRFRRTGGRSMDQEAFLRSFRLVTDVIYHLVGWEFFKEDIYFESRRIFPDKTRPVENVVENTDYVYTTHSLISFLCHRRCPESRLLAQYVYDGVVALFSCHDSVVRREAQQLLHSIFGTVMLCRICSFFRTGGQGDRVLLDTDTFLDALIESFSDLGNPLPFKTLSVVFIQAYELVGGRGEGFCTEMYKEIFSKLETMCKSSDARCRDSGINGIMCVVASIPVRELVLLKIPEDAFGCIYLYVRALKSREFMPALRLALFILRFRFGGIRKHLESEGVCDHLSLSQFTVFVEGLLDRNKHVVEFSRIVLSEIVVSYGAGVVRKHVEKIFKFLKQEYVVDNRTMMIIQLQVFVFCVREGLNPFGESEMRYLLGKFLDNISGNASWMGVEGGGVFDVRRSCDGGKEYEYCRCVERRKESEGGDEDLVVFLSDDVYKKLCELSIKDLIELGLRDATSIMCIRCKKKVYKELGGQGFGNEGEELVHWMREFYLIVVEYSRNPQEIRAGILFLFRHGQQGKKEQDLRAYEMRKEETREVVQTEIGRMVSGKIDHRVLSSLAAVYNLVDMSSEPGVGMVVSQILREFRTEREFTIMMQDSRYSILAGAFEVGLLVGEQDTLCGEILDTYIVMDTHVRSYTAEVYPQMVEYANRFAVEFASHVFKKIQEPSIYELCVRVYGDSGEFRRIVEKTRERFGDRIVQSLHGLGESHNVDVCVFVYGYRFLECAGYEMRPMDIQAMLGMYSDLKSRYRDTAEIRELLGRNVGRFSSENFETLFKLDPLFVAGDGICVESFRHELSVGTLKSMLRSIDRRDVSGFEGLVDVFGESCYLLVELFVSTGFRSNKLLKYCKETLHNANLRGLLLYYLCTFEPLYVYFEVLFKMPYEDRRYTQYCLERVVDAFEPHVFEELILIVLRSEVRFKTNMYVLFPLFVSRPGLIGKRVAYELIGSIYKLINFFSYGHQKMAVSLFEILCSRYPVGSGELSMGKEYDAAMVNTYTFLFVNFIHLKTGSIGEMFRRQDLELNLELVSYSAENINVGNVVRFLLEELESGKEEGYKRRLVRSVGMAVQPYFGLRPLSKVVVGYFIDNGIWSYEQIRVEESEGRMRYNSEVVYNLLCVLCDRMENGSSRNEPSVDMDVCVSIIRYLFSEYSKGAGRALEAEYIKDGVKRMQHLVSTRTDTDGVVQGLVQLYIDSFRNCSVDVSPLEEGVVFFTSDRRVTLAEKIELVVLLENRKYDERFVCEVSIPIFARYRHSQTSGLKSLQRVFMRGLCSGDGNIRNSYFDLLDSSVPMNKYLRLQRLLGMEWRWNDRLCYTMLRMMMMSYHKVEVVADRYYENGSDAGFEYPWSQQRREVLEGGEEESGASLVTNFFEDIDSYRFKVGSSDLFDILYYLGDALHPVMSGVLRATVGEFGEEECREIFKSFVSFSPEIMEDGKLVGAFVEGLEPVYKHVDMSELIRVFRGGDSWAVLLEYATDRQRMEIYREVGDRDRFFGMSRAMSCFPETMQGCFLQQIGKTREAQQQYEATQRKAGERRISFNEEEYGRWQEEWIGCAKELQQWDVCYNLGIHKGDCSLSVESMWHMSDFNSQVDVGNFKALVSLQEEGFEKEFYETFVSLFGEYSGEKIRRCVIEGIKQMRSYPRGSGAGARILMYLQIVMEMVESEPIFNNRMDTMESLTSILFRWKDKEPLGHEGLGIWGLFRTWRRHVYSRLGGLEKMYGGEVRVHEEMGVVGSRRSPMQAGVAVKEMVENGLRIRREVGIKGINETARVLNGFAGAAIEHGHHDVALFSLKEMFDLSSIKVGDAFQKVVHELECLLSKREYKAGMELCGSTNIQHFNEMQSSVLFSLRGQFSERQGRHAEAERLYLQSVQICNVVGENWLRWGSYLFRKAEREGGSVEEAFLAATQAITHCSGDKAQRGILKMILLMRRGSEVCDGEMFQKIVQEMDMSRFIYFVPQLIRLLSTRNAEVVQMILVGMSKEYLHAVVSGLRIAREQLRRQVYPRSEEYNSQVARMKRLRMDGGGSAETERCGDTEQCSEWQVRHLENISRVYGMVKEKGLGWEMGRIGRYLQNSLNSYVFKEEEEMYLQIEKIMEEAVQHVTGRKVPSKEHAVFLNELIFHVSSSSLSSSFREVVMESIFGMEYLCPLERIDELVVFKQRVKKVVEGSFYRMNKFEDSEINQMLQRSAYSHEVFGQYSEIRSSYRKMVRIEMFEPRWSYVYKKKIGYNRIHVRGDDGRVYRYEMRGQTSTHGSESVLAQLSLMVDEEIRRNGELARRGAGLKLFVPVAVSETVVVVCVKEPMHDVDSVVEESVRRHDVTMDQCVLLYLNQFSNIYEGEEDGLRCRYDVRNGLRRATGRRMNVDKDECPNIRHRRGELSVGMENGGGADNIRLMVARQKEKYVKGLRQKETLCLGCDNGRSDDVWSVRPCVYRYEISQKRRHAAYEKVYNTFEMDSYIKDYLKGLYGNVAEYFRFTTNMLVTYATNTAFQYTFFMVDRRPRNIVFTRRTGHFMNRRVFYEGNGVPSGSKGATGIISPGYQCLFGKEGVEGTMLSVLYHYGSMLDGSEWYEDLLRVMLEECWEEVVGERFADVSHRMLARISYMREKSENGTYNVIPLVSEWMDTFRLAQTDPGNQPWF